MPGPPSEIVRRLDASGAKHAYIDGGITVQQFLRAGAIQRLTITRVPVLVGQGIPLFGSLPQDVKLRHETTRTYTSGLAMMAAVSARKTTALKRWLCGSSQSSRDPFSRALQELGHSVHKGTTEVERNHQFSKFLIFGGERGTEEQQSGGSRKGNHL